MTERHRLPWIVRHGPWWLRRLYWRLRCAVGGYQELNARAKVETEIWECAGGKRPMPDAEQLREWALRLGMPEGFRGRP